MLKRVRVFALFGSLKIFLLVSVITVSLFTSTGGEKLFFFPHIHTRISKPGGGGARI